MDIGLICTSVKSVGIEPVYTSVKNVVLGLIYTRITM